MIRVYYLASFLALLRAAVIRREDLILNNVEERDTFLTPEDFLESRRLLEVSLSGAGVDTSADPLLRANKFEGDIAGLSSSTIHQYVNNSNSFARNAIKDSWRRWPNGEIPYVISSRYGTYSKRIIAKAMDEYHKKTCIRFIPRDENKHRDYIYIFPDDGCYSLVGRTGGRQSVSLDSGCMQTGTVQHELMHAAGFFHEQSRSDRDDYIEIIFTNVQPDATDQFEKYSLRTITLLDLPYDYGSIMHYGPFAFSKNGKRTIKALKSGADRMGQRDGFSDLDLQKLNKLYQCNADKDSQGGTTPSFPSPSTREPLITESGRCENKKWQCFFWSKMFYCRIYPDYMRQNCPKSCDMCAKQLGRSDQRDPPMGNVRAIATTSTPDNEECRDSDNSCPTWARKGFCSKTGYTAYMRQTCPVSCGLCVPASPPTMSSMADDDETLRK